MMPIPAWSPTNWFLGLYETIRGSSGPELWSNAAMAIELTLGYLIRDNLFFNILMLIYPLDGVKAWQSALPG